MKNFRFASNVHLSTNRSQTFSTSQIIKLYLPRMKIAWCMLIIFMLNKMINKICCSNKEMGKKNKTKKRAPNNLAKSFSADIAMKYQIYACNGAKVIKSLWNCRSFATASQSSIRTKKRATFMGSLRLESYLNKLGLIVRFAMFFFAAAAAALPLARNP